MNENTPTINKIKKTALSMIDDILSGRIEEKNVKMFCQLSNVALSSMKVECALKMIESKNSGIKMIE